MSVVNIQVKVVNGRTATFQQLVACRPMVGDFIYCKTPLSGGERTRYVIKEITHDESRDMVSLVLFVDEVE